VKNFVTYLEKFMEEKMKLSNHRSKRSVIRTAMFLVVATAVFGAALLAGSNRASANHPVLVEGNCDSPVPGTTLVAPGTCGDYDGDGRIGTAEDTDGSDRIFGTLRAALGPGTGAAAGTGANWNGKIIIVASGRFAEQLFIGNLGFIPGEGTATPGNLTIEAAPGVNADIDAVLQGDPAGGNGTRQGGTGIGIVYTDSDKVVTLRNLQLRNWATAIGIFLNSRVHIDNCRLEGNFNHGIRISDNSRVVVSRSQIDSSGRRIPVTGVPAPGSGITVEGTAQARIEFTNISHSAGAGISSSSSSPVFVFKVSTYFNNPNLLSLGGSVISAPDNNFAQ
jgi:hypothetical protein